jgi:hypothetical protein
VRTDVIALRRRDGCFHLGGHGLVAGATKGCEGPA